jgi:hypothetical protein
VRPTCKGRCHKQQATAKAPSQGCAIRGFGDPGFTALSRNGRCHGQQDERLTELLGPEVSSRLRPSICHSLCPNLLELVQCVGVVCSVRLWVCSLCAVDMVVNLVILQRLLSRMQLAVAKAINRLNTAGMR